MIRLKRACIPVILMGMAASTVVASERMEDGRRTYEVACAHCHDAGLDGAPRKGQAGDWSDRSHLWEAVLFEHAEKGYLLMPAKGGDAGLNEYDVDAAAEYLLTETHPQLQPD